MSRYIDSDKLIERLEEMKRAEYENCGGINSKTGALQEVQELIESLQHEQPEVDLEEEIFKAEKKYGDIDEMGGYQILLFDDEFRDILRYFYGLGKTARKEE